MTLCKPYAIFLAGLSLLILLSGCARTTTQSQPEDLPPVKTIIVLPVEIGRDSQSSRSPKETQQLEKGQVLLDNMLAEYFSGRKDIALLTPDQRDALEKEMIRCRTNAVVTICRTKIADAVLLCTVQRFIEREGNEYSIVSPASVAFDYKLIQAETGQILCSGAFNETQQGLLADIFQFFKKAQRGVKWLSAEELAREGFQQKIADCLYLRK
ncbi:MAG: hypothetical protein A2505_00645 [Deltaproteobacteria bacterium RIFOXYD12_FULL_55_16]|nr:MAG: hypothetical protein A2505_00645 [Deltaproteobacteria bacterium RIFOXYD12_FULL_55_16]